MIHLREVTKENFEEVIKLEIKESQFGMVESPLLSLAQAKVDSRLKPFGMYYNDTIVGFLLLELHRDRVPHYVYLSRILIDKQHQGKGYGRATLALANQWIKDEGFAFSELIHFPENKVAAHLYESFGYELTNLKREDEVVRRAFFDQ